MLCLTVVQPSARRKRRAGHAALYLRLREKLQVAGSRTAALPACRAALPPGVLSSAAGYPQALAWHHAGAVERVEVDDLLHDDTRVGSGLGLRGDRPQGLARVDDHGGQILVDRGRR